MYIHMTRLQKHFSPYIGGGYGLHINVRRLEVLCRITLHIELPLGLLRLYIPCHSMQFDIESGYGNQ